jgi:glycosyltransferase involved in cell wall biosynthesis
MRLNSGEGSSTHIWELCCNLRELGNRIIFIQGSHNKFKIDLNDDFTLREYKDIPVYFKQIYIPKYLKQQISPVIKILYNYYISKELKNIIKETNIDVVHERATLFGFSASLSKLKPNVLEVNAPLAEEYQHFYSYSCWDRTIFKKLANKIERYALANADKIIAVSKNVRNYIISKGIDPSKVTVIPNGANTDLFNPNVDGSMIRSKFGLTDEPIIIFSGSLQPWHGVDQLLDAFPNIMRTIPRARLLIVGGGIMKKEIESKISKNRLNKSVILTGRVNYKEMPKYLAAADIAVAPYPPLKDFYFSPIKLFEYMAMGKPIVASNLGQISEVLTHRETGILFQAGNINEMCHAIIELLHDKYLARKIGENARKLALKEYNWKKTAQMVDKVYREIVY